MAASCAPGEEGGGDDFLDCQGKCDTAGALTLSSRWVPVGGSIRAKASGSFEVSPSDGVNIQERSGGRHVVTFSNAGYYVARSGGSSLPIRVADDGLQVELLSPAPGDFVAAAEGETIQVQGRITDSLGGEIGSVKVAGRTVSLDPSGGFELGLPASFGINTIEIDASDLAGNEFDTARSFMAAREFSNAPRNTFVQLDNEALSFISEAVEPKLSALLSETLRELSSRTDSIGGADDKDIFVDSIQFPGINGAPGSLNLEIETAQAGVLRAVLRTQGDTVAEVNTGDGLFDFRATITGKDLFATLTMDFSDFQSVGPIVSELTLGFAPGQDSFDINVINLPEFIENFFVDDDDTQKEIANGIKDAVAPGLSAVFTSFAGTFDLNFRLLGEDQNLRLEYQIANVRAVEQALQIDLAAQFPALAQSDGPGSPSR
jgi:hypothetical protein